MDTTDDKYARMGETIFAAISLTALSDFALFDGKFGLSLVLLGLAGAMVALTINRACSKERLVSSAASYALALLPVLENISILSVCVFVTMSAVGTLIISDGLRCHAVDAFWRIAQFFLTIPVRSTIDIMRWRKVAKALGAPVLRFAQVGIWIMPIVIGLVFLALFEDANPIIAALIAKIDLWYLLRFLDIERALFWVMMFVLIWPFLRARLPQRKVKAAVEVKANTENAAASGETLERVLFGPAAILRSLLVFNVLFAVQSLLDATYLIGGVSLPQGMTYAGYAHRGAYPLIITTLLAAAFVLIALREGSQARENMLIRSLVYVWVVQNVLLVLSSILRLDLYVGTYGLTYWRIAAFIWMGLVALGLLTIIWRIWATKSTQWLVGANLVTGAVVLYSACFLNFGLIIAKTNIALGGRDMWYVINIGAPVLPAVDQYLKTAGEGEPKYYFNYEYGSREKITLAEWRTATAVDFLNNTQDWRSWTLRGWRLKRYLDQNPVVISRAPETRR